MVKKIFLYIFFLIASHSIYAQSDSIVYYKYLSYKGITTKDSANYFTYPYKNDSINGHVYIYYIEGVKYLDCNFKNKHKDGQEIQWHLNGIIKSKFNYEYGEKKGECIEWYEDGRIKSKGNYDGYKKTGNHFYYSKDTNYYYIDEFRNGIFISGKKLDLFNNIVKEYSKLEIPASYVGGEDSLLSYFKKMLIYPSEEERLNIQGQVKVYFEVDEKGYISKVRVIKSVSSNFDKEALRVIQLMPKWNPAIERDEFVKGRMIQTINFKLPN